MDKDKVKKKKDEKGAKKIQRAVKDSAKEKIPDFCKVVIGHCQQHCATVVNDCELTILLIGEDGEIYS